MAAIFTKFRTLPASRIFAIWFAWLAILIAFQAIVQARFTPQYPDQVFQWTVEGTKKDYQKPMIYLNEPLLNNQVAWDSEFYLSIATKGYDDPAVRSISIKDTKLSLNYAFMPFYPFMISLFVIPLRLLGLNVIATASLAGVIVSALGTLLGLIALYDLAQEEMEDAGGMRAVFYMLVFPAGFFFAQVYTEGLFVGLAFASLALLRRKKLIPAAILAALATWTRAVGVALVIPMTMEWFREYEWIPLDRDWEDIFHSGIPWKSLAKALTVFAPLIAFGVWKFSYVGQAFSIVEDLFFGRGFFNLGVSFDGWIQGLLSVFGRNTELYGNNATAGAYYLIEWLGIALGIFGGIWYLRRKPDLALFSLAVIVLSVTSGGAQGMIRYIMGAPTTFLILAQMGKNPVFDRVWTVASILLMGMLATLFTFNMWVA